MVLSFLKSSGGYRWGLSQRESQGNAPAPGLPTSAEQVALDDG